MELIIQYHKSLSKFSMITNYYYLQLFGNGDSIESEDVHYLGQSHELSDAIAGLNPTHIA
jgi:hypothetical protein